MNGEIEIDSVELAKLFKDKFGLPNIKKACFRVLDENGKNMIPESEHGKAFIFKFIFSEK